MSEPYRSNAVDMLLLKHVLDTAGDFVNACESDPGWPHAKYIALVEALETVHERRPSGVEYDLVMRISRHGEGGQKP